MMENSHTGCSRANDANVIKAIFPEEYENHENLTDKLVEKYYKIDNIFKNAFQVSDQLTNINCSHCLSTNVRTKENDNEFKITDEISYRVPLIEHYSIDELNSYNISYHKILSAKDIYWENSYIRYAPLSYNNLQKPIYYYDINSYTGEKENEGYEYAYIYPTNIPSRINNTYELFTLIDYLLLKIRSLRFFLDNVKLQNLNAKTAEIKQKTNE